MDEHCETPSSSSFSEQTDYTPHTIPSSTSDTLTDTFDDSTDSDVAANSTNQSTVFLYGEDTSERIYIMASAPDPERSQPFLQRIQLIGPGNSVRATGQVDDGAMRNCISKRRWDQYGHCLTPLQPSTTRISVANGTEIKSLGRWYGMVQISGIRASCWFEVFDCQGAFDVILGKP